MNREVHVRFWEGLAVRFRWATQLVCRDRQGDGTDNVKAAYDVTNVPEAIKGVGSLFQGSEM